MKKGWQTSTLGDVLAVLRNGVNCKQDKSGKGDKISRIESISEARFDLGKVGYAELPERDKERYLIYKVNLTRYFISPKCDSLIYIDFTPSLTDCLSVTWS